MKKYRRENNQLKCRHVLQMNYFKDSCESFCYAKPVKLFFSLAVRYSGQVITINDLQQILMFLDTRQNLTIKISGLKNRILSCETAAFPVKSVSA